MKKLNQKRQPRLIIEKDFQLRFTLKICILNGVLFAVFAGVFLYFIGINYEMLIDGALQAYSGSTQNPIADLQRERNFVASLVVGALIFMILILFISGLYLSQQVAGPLFSLKSRLREFAEGRPRVRMHLRRGDEFKNLEDIFNFAMEKHEERRSELQAKLEKLKGHIKNNDGAAAKLIDEISQKFL